MKLSHMFTGGITALIASQLAHGEYTRRTGPFAYFQANYGTRDFSEMNKIIDAYFAVPRQAAEAQAFLEAARFECRMTYPHKGPVIVDPRSNIKIDLSTPWQSLGCNYPFGGWLPYPDLWIVSVHFGEDGLSNFLMRQRLAY